MSGRRSSPTSLRRPPADRTAQVLDTTRRPTTRGGSALNGRSAAGWVRPLGPRVGEGPARTQQVPFPFKGRIGGRRCGEPMAMVLPSRGLRSPQGPRVALDQGGREYAFVREVLMDGTQSIRRETLDGIRRKLLDRQRALFDDMECLKADLGILEEGREAELETRGQSEAMTQVLDRVRERDRHELEEVYRALTKIPAREYGVCARCHQPIAVERLLVIPQVRYCLDCERALERAPAAPPRPFEPRSHRAVPSDYCDLENDDLAEAVRERIRAHGDRDLRSPHRGAHRGRCGRTRPARHHSRRRAPNGRGDRRRARLRHDALSDRRPCRLVGRPLPGQQRKRREAPERPHSLRQPDATRGARRERPRRCPQTRLLPRGPVPPPGQWSSAAATRRPSSRWPTASW